MLDGMAAALEAAEDGWYEWVAAPAGTRILVQLEQAPDGRFHVAGLRLAGRLSAEVLRSVPLGRIEAAANALFHGGAPPGRAAATIARDLRANAVPGYPDTFYDAVATAYRSLVATTSRPIGELAQANGVPATTAQRWVREARRRGKLPPGRPGKSG